MKKILLIDGHNLLFRMFYGIPNPILNTQGKDIRGLIGFVSNILKLSNEFPYTDLLVVFDSETSTQDRLAEDSAYKQNRVDYSQVPEEENPFTQLNYIYKALDYMNVNYYEAKTCEADDYIASVCKIYEATHEVTILSTDRDFLQLVNDRVNVFSPRGKFSINFTADKVIEKFGVRPDQIIDYKTIVGDKSDNIAGIKGVGPKTAIKIFAFGTLDEILEGQTDLDEKLYSKLDLSRDMIIRNRKLVTMKLDMPVHHADFSISFNKNAQTRDIIKACGYK